MYSEEGIATEMLDLKRPIQKKEGKKEYRQHYHMQELRYETAEN